MQPLPAHIGLIFCILTVFVFATAGWWNHGEQHIDIYSTFVGVSTIISKPKALLYENHKLTYLREAHSSRDILAHPKRLQIRERL